MITLQCIDLLTTMHSVLSIHIVKKETLGSFSRDAQIWHIIMLLPLTSYRYYLFPWKNKGNKNFEKMQTYQLEYYYRIS